MIVERGPHGRLHVPKYKKGCYRGRMTDCCLLCIGRVISSAAIVASAKREYAREEDHHDIIEEEVIVPCIDHSSDGGRIEQKSGKIEAVHLFSGSEAAMVTVRTDDDELIHIDFTADEQGQVLET